MMRERRLWYSTCRVIWLFLGGIRKIEPNIKYRIVWYNIIRTAARLPRLPPLFVRFLRKSLGPIESTVVAFIVNPREIMQPGHSWLVQILKRGVLLLL